MDPERSNGDAGQGMSEEHSEGTSRRGFLKLAGGAVFGAGMFALAGCADASEEENGEPTGPESEDGSASGGAMRFAFLTDTHLRREFDSEEGLARAIQAAQELDPAPQFIVTGGDLVQNLRDEDLEGGNELCDLFVEVFDEHATVPVYHCIGNHDAAGWRDGDIPEDDPQFGFAMIVEKLGLEAENYSFDEGGWHFVILNNTNLTEPGEYIGEFTDEMLDFLREDLAANADRPTMLFGHIPPVSAIEFFNGAAELDGRDWILEADRTSVNPADLVEAMDEGNVRAFLSGHIHRLDRIEAAGHTFITCGSVSGDQWEGDDVDTSEGFGVVDCFPDGTFEFSYFDYGWEPSAEALEAAEED